MKRNEYHQKLVNNHLKQPLSFLKISIALILIVIVMLGFLDIKLAGSIFLITVGGIIFYGYASIRTVSEKEIAYILDKDIGEKFQIEGKHNPGWIICPLRLCDYDTIIKSNRFPDEGTHSVFVMGGASEKNLDPLGQQFLIKADIACNYEIENFILLKETLSHNDNYKKLIGGLINMETQIELIAAAFNESLKNTSVIKSNLDKALTQNLKDYGITNVRTIVESIKAPDEILASLNRISTSISEASAFANRLKILANEAGLSTAQILFIEKSIELLKSSDPNLNIYTMNTEAIDSFIKKVITSFGNTVPVMTSGT